MLTATIIAKQLLVPVAAWGLSLGTFISPGGGMEGHRALRAAGGMHGHRAVDGGGMQSDRATYGLILVGNKDSRKPPPPPPPKKN